MLFKRFVPLVFSFLPTLAAPSPLTSVRKTKNPVPGRYIVTYKNYNDSFPCTPSIFNKLSLHSNVTHEWDIISGFAGSFTDYDMEILRAHPNVVSIEEDGYAHTQTVATQ